jgi:ornithine cyclodeaminase
VLSRGDVEGLLTVEASVELIESVFLSTGTPAIVQPVRTVLRVPGHTGVLASMPAFLQDGETGGFGIKAVVVNPANAALGLETHQGVVIAFEAGGMPSLVIEAGSLTAIRTAAASAVATRALAVVRSGRVAVLGTGLQARLHLRAITSIIPVEATAVWGRDAEKARELASWAEQNLGLNVEVCPTVAEATRDADVISTVTSAHEPILTAADVRAGAHINAVGACLPDVRELSADLIGRARIVVDQRDAARVEAGDLLLAVPEVGPVLDGMVELGEILRGEIRGRLIDDITVFESLGFAALDVATARHLVGLALTRDVGVEIAFGEPPLTRADRGR